MSFAEFRDVQLAQINAFVQSGHMADYLTPFLVNLVVAGLIYIVGSWVIRKLLSLLQRIMRKKSADAALSNFVFTLLSLVLKFILIILVLEQIGINTTSLLALLGAAGLAIGLAVKDSLSNFASGVMLIMMKPFKAGDYIEVAGTAGIVEKVSIISTVLLSTDNKEIIVPNAQIYEGTITNYSARSTRRIDISIAITYQANLQQAKAVIARIIETDERTLKLPAPIIVVSDLSTNGVVLLVRVWVERPHYWEYRWHLFEQIKLQFDQHGIDISPARHEVKVQN